MSFIDKQLLTTRHSLIKNDQYLANIDPTILQWHNDNDGTAHLISDNTLLKSKHENSKPTPATLSIIAYLLTDGYRLTPCGKWRGPSKADNKFSNTSATVVATTPHRGSHKALLDTEFKTGLEILATLLNKGTTQDEPHNIFNEEHTRITLCHVLFEKIEV
jgi:hypothetical protein